MSADINSNVKMPVLFIGHGNPMNAVYKNAFTHTLASEGEALKKLNPAAVLVVSAHWLSNGTRSEEHTSELQSLRHLVCRLLLENKHKMELRLMSKSGTGLAAPRLVADLPL